jgi:hypothetical protein
VRRPFVAVVPFVAFLILAMAQSGVAQARSSSTKCDAKRQHFQQLGKKRTRLKHALPYLTVAADENVRVYRTTRNFVEDRYYVCRQSTGRARFVARDLRTGGAATTEYGVDEFSIRSTSDDTRTYIAFRAFTVGDVNDERFVVVDVKGRRVHDTGRLAETATFDTRDGEVLGLTRSGAFAFEHLGVLIAVDASGSRVLATPAGGAVDNVGAAGQTVYWTQGGVARSVALT